MLKDIEAVLFDIDGTIFQGDRLIEGAKETIEALQAEGKKIAYVSNRGNVSQQEGCNKLTLHGIKADPSSLIFSSTVTALFMKTHYPKAAVWILGNKGLGEEMALYGVLLAKKPEDADFVVITLHDEITYSELNEAFKATSMGARLIATNADKTYPNEDGAAIDVAGFIGAIEAATGRKTELIIGKPSCFMAEAALNYLQTVPSSCLIVGDSLESDIGLGRMQGMKTALVLTGNASKAEVDRLPQRRRPDYILSSIAELRRYV